MEKALCTFGTSLPSTVPKSYRAASIVTVATLFAVTLFPSASLADVSSPGFPQLNPFSPNYPYAAQWKYQINTSVVSNSGPVGSAQGNYPHDQATAYDVQPFPLPVTTAVAELPLGYPFGGSQTIAQGTVAGSAGPGTLKAYAQAYARAGTADAQVVASFTFLDEMTVSSAGLPKLTFQMSGSASRDYVDLNNYAWSQASADLYAWRFGSGLPPPQGVIFSPTYHERIALLSDGSTTDSSEKALDFSTAFTEGSHWWIAARLEVDAVAHLGFPQAFPLPEVQATADISHTVTFHIDPDPSTPQFAFTTSSGQSYVTAVPEPENAFLFGAGLVLVVWRRRTDHAGCSSLGNSTEKR